MEDRLKKWLKELRLNESTISMILGGLVVVVVGILIYNYFANVGKQPTADTEATQSATTPVELVNEDGKMVPKGLPTTHKVAKGEDLWQIAQKYYGSGYNWVDIAQANKLRNPNLVAEGQELAIPKTEVKGKVSAASAATGNVIEGATYTVQTGDNLWKIAVRAYQDGYKWPQIAAANKAKLKNPNALEKGMQLTLPR